MNSVQFAFKGFEISELLSRHGETCAWKAYDIIRQRSIILKSVHSDSPPLFLMERLKHEYDIGRRFRHPNIIRYLGLLTHHHRVAIVTEDFSGTPLAENIPEQGFALGTFLQLALQLTDALAEIHRQKVIHKDLNPYNIVYNPEKRLLKVIDFGMATILTKESPLHMRTSVMGGNLPYTAPEQTGRLNRLIDHRTDFYGLGVTFYEMLCGQRPFNAEDPLELVHAHLTQLPPRISEWRSDIPPIFDAIIQKLLAKNSEDRYQSAEGLRYDLEECLRQWREHQAFSSFEVGRHDHSEQFSIPQKLYGRDSELEILNQTFEHASQGLTELLWVSGFSGMGKTTLVNEIKKPLSRRKGYFAAGKFERLRQNIPFSGLSTALEGLVQQLLTEPDIRLNLYKKRLLSALGSHAGLLKDLIPSVEVLINLQPEHDQCSDQERMQLLPRLIQTFINVLAVKEHPIVIFLDDMQWADQASLSLIESILSELQGAHLLIIGAYRDDDIKTLNPLQAWQKSLQQAFNHIQHIKLEPLKESDLSQMVSDTLQLSREKSASLARYLFQKTRGNPFNIVQSLNQLHQENFITFSRIKRVWEYQLPSEHSNLSAQSLVDVVVARVNRFESKTRRILHYGACLGSSFELATIARLLGLSETQVNDQLWPAIEAGLVVVQSRWSDYEAADAEKRLTCRFLHDRVQQAAYELYDRKLQQRHHIDIGLQLLNAVQGTPEQNELLFEIVNQLNAGTEQLNKEEKLTAAQVNLKAAQKSQHTTAFESASYYAQMGILMLGSDAWEHYATLRFQLGCVLAECEGLSGRFQHAQDHIDLLKDYANSTRDKVHLKLIETNLAELQGEYSRAIHILLEGLTLMGMHFPANEQERKAALQAQLNELPNRLDNLDNESLLNRQEIPDAEQLTIMRLLMRLWTPCYIAREQSLLALVSISLVDETFKHGLCEFTPFAYASFGFIYGTLTEDYCTAYLFGKAGVDLAKRYANITVQARTYFLFGFGINNLQNPVAESIEWLEKAYKTAIEAGDQVYAGYSAYYLITDRFIQGKPLSQLVEDYYRYLDLLKKENPPLYQVALAFTCVLDGAGQQLHGHRFDRNAFLKEYCHIPVFMAGYDFGTLNQKFWGNAEDDLITAAESAQISVPETLHGSIKVPDTLFMNALAFLWQLEKRDLEEDRRQQLEAYIQSNLDKLRAFTDNCTSNYLPKFLLLKAEMARVDNDSLEAMELYEAAIDAASDSHLMHIEALANECYANFWLAQRRNRIATLYLRRAYYLYKSWEYEAKALRLERQYPELIAEQHGQSVEHNDSPYSQTHTQLQHNLDWLTALKASQAIMDNMQSDNIGRDLIRVLAKNAGASRAVLLLSDKAQLLRVHATYPESDLEENHFQSLDQCDETLLAKPVAHFVQRTRNATVIADTGTEQRFFSSLYMKKRKPRSVMVVPLLDAGQLSGLIYFENDQVAHSFQQDRLDLIKVLGGHVIGALRNARLLEDLRNSEQRFRDLVEGSVQGIVIHKEMKPLFVNQAFAAMVGYSQEELMAMDNLVPLVPKDNRQYLLKFKSMLESADSAPSRFDFEVKTKGGKQLILDNMSRIVQWQDDTAIQSTLIDITSRVAYEQQIEHMASHDSLSTLPNRMLFQDRLSHALAQSERHQEMGAVLLLDLDRFKEINDTLGHNIGDELIKGVAKRLSSQIKDSDTVARLGGDEFAIILESVGNEDTIANITQRMIDALARPFTFDGHEIYTSASIGIALFPNDSCNIDELVRYADLAMYSAKSSKGNQFHFFQQDMNLALRKKKALADEIRQGIERDEFYLAYQPQVDSTHYKLQGFESLLRWKKPNGTPIPPCEFLPIAEQCGLMTSLGEWVLRESCRQAAVWQCRNKDFVIAVNVSAVQFHQSDLATTVATVLNETGLDPKCLELEITESLLMQNVESAIETMHKLNQLGVKLAIDDFGTGYSSLSYLKRFPVQKIKIDAAFTRDLANEADSRAIAKAIIELGKILEMQVIAEGVETVEQRQILQDMGCDTLQGYLFSRPEIALEAERWLET